MKNEMSELRFETDRLLIRKFEETDMEELYLLLKDEEVNTFLPWFPVKNVEETKEFYRKHFAGEKYGFAICLKEDNYPIGYIKAETNENHDFGYALRKEFWHRGIVTEASKVLVEQLKKDIPVIFRVYQLNLDEYRDRVYKKSWNTYENHFIETVL